MGIFIVHDTTSRNNRRIYELRNMIYVTRVTLLIGMFIVHTLVACQRFMVYVSR